MNWCLCMCASGFLSKTICPGEIAPVVFAIVFCLVATAMTPLPASKALDVYFLEARCKLLDIAAILDRISRGAGAETVESDPRMQRIRRAIQTLLEQPSGRAEVIQTLFSLEYDPNWERPQPR